MISIYVIQILLILFFGYIFRNDKKKFLRVAFVILFVLMAFRHARMVGADSSSSYYEEFIRIKGHSISWPNPGLPMMMKVVNLFGGDYQWVIIITAVVVCFSYYKLLLKYSENSFISVMWFLGMLFYTFLFSALKQAWAMAFICFAFNAVFEKKLFRYLLFIGLAVVFHFPALVFLPAYWIARLKINKAFPLLMVSVLVFVYILRTQLLNLMVSAYENGENEFNYVNSFIGTKFIIMLVILGYAFYVYFTHEKENKIFSALLYFMGIAAVIQTFCFYSNIFERLADYYYQFSILFMPLILKRDASESLLINKKEQYTISESGEVLGKKKIGNLSINDINISVVLAVIITVFCVWRFTSSVTNDALLSPFYFFWQNVKLR